MTLATVESLEELFRPYKYNPATAATATTAPTRLFLLSTLPLALEKKSMVDRLVVDCGSC
jgi:hypothetical protein